MVAAALISAGATLLGGLLAPKPKYVVPDYAKIRSGAEAAGFNPLTALTQGPAGQVVQPENYMGNAIASAGLMLADNMTKAARAARLQKLTGENEKLQDKVQRLTLQPKVGGVYARRESVPTLRAALGAKGSSSASTGSPVSANAFDRMANSPFAGAVVGPDDDNLTGPQLSVKKDVPAFRFLGHDFYGSGLFSTAQQFEDALGEGELLQTGTAAVLGADAVGNEAYKAYQYYIGQPFVNWGKSLFAPNKAAPKPVGKRPSWLPQGAYP